MTIGDEQGTDRITSPLIRAAWFLLLWIVIVTPMAMVLPYVVNIPIQA